MTDGTTGTAPAQRSRAQLAKSYASRGWFVLPTSGKRPIIENWDNTCSVDPDEVRAAWSSGGEWHGFNIAVACGRSGLVVIDVDRKDGRDGFAELERLGIELPPTYTVRTPSGGMHYYYLTPRGILIGSGSNVLAPGIDVRADRGIVVAAGSVSDKGPYVVVSSLEVAPLPGRLVDALAGRATPLEERRAARLPDIIPQGERDQTLASLAGTMRRRGASVGAILAALQVENNERCVPPMSDADLERIAGSVGRYDPEGPPPGVEDEIEVDPDLLSKQLTILETTRRATQIMKSRDALRQREILGGMGEPVDVLAFVAAGPDPVATCIWGNAVKDGMMAWAANQGVIICGPPGTGKSTIALQVILRRVGILGGDVLGLPVRVERNGVMVYMALDRADQIRQSIRRMVPEDADPEAVKRLLMIDNIPPNVDLREVSTWITWLQALGATGVVLDSAKDLGFDLNDSSEGQAFNFLVQATLRAGIQIMVTHHSRKTPRGDKKPLTLNDMHGSQWVAAGAGSVLMLDGEAGPQPKRLVHVKPLTVPMPPLLLELDASSGEVGYREDDERDDSGAYKPRIGTLQDRILELLSTEAEPISGEALARALDSNSGSVSKACRALAERDLVIKGKTGWVLLADADLEDAG